MRREELLRKKKQELLSAQNTATVMESKEVRTERWKCVNVVSDVNIAPLEKWPDVFDSSILLEDPTEMQRYVIPYLLAGRGVDVVSETGSGKTLSYVLSYVHLLCNENGTLLVIVPTRELALQISGLFKKFSDGRLIIVEIVGGRSIDVQRVELGGRHNVVVSTPGRMMELLTAGYIERFKYVVVDEIDRLLSSDLKKETEFILERIKPCIYSRFSATMFDCTSTTRIIVGKVGVNKNVQQFFIYVEQRNKLNHLKAVLKQMTASDDLSSFTSSTDHIQTIVFCNKIETCEMICKSLRGARMLHSGMDAEDRESTARAMHDKRGGVFVTTDVSCRGIDVRNVDLVVHYDFPRCMETYIHRCGRSGRGRRGASVSLLCNEDKAMFGRLRRLIEEDGGDVPEFLCVGEEYIVD